MESKLQFEKKKHGAAINILRNALFEIGGRLFSEACLRIKAEDDAEVKETLNTIDFANKLFSGVDLGLNDEDKFKSLLQSLELLLKFQEDGKAN